MRTTGIKQNLKLDRIIGARPDRQGLSIIPFKKEFSFPVPAMSRKTMPNITKNGYKF